MATDFRAAFSAALDEPAGPVPAGLTTRDGRADPVRFAVYRNNVAVGLVGALEAAFPVTLRLVGEEFFRGLARVYVARTKPASPLLFRYGGDFPAFVAGFPPAAGLPYLADVARLEVAWLRAYHAAEAEAIGPQALSGIAPERLGAVRLRPHPAAALVVSEHPVGSIWQAHQGDTVVPPTVWSAESVAVTRPGAEVSARVIPRADAAFLAGLLGGASLAAAAEQGFSADEAFDFGRSLVGLLAAGLFAAVEETAPA
ncbi:DNA-binding domain-containing protein [Prosthecomicrobium sp. N25]|uniref:DNA-binding domain-containing protein n=1 Tax=Prosthecomicrobium sp. N25 TaxID=3129254 RepID=UPI0030789569